METKDLHSLCGFLQEALQKVEGMASAMKRGLFCMFKGEEPHKSLLRIRELGC